MDRCRLARASIWCALVLMFAYRISISVADPDLFHEMAFARELLVSGSFPRADVFAFTPTRFPVVHHEWGAGVIAYFIVRAVGGVGVLVLRYALAIAAALIALVVARRCRSSDVVWALVPIAILLSDYGFSPVRAQAYSFVFAACTILCLSVDRAGNRRWMVFYLFMLVVWANVHGGVVIGPALVAAECVERVLTRRPWRHLAGLLVASALALVLTPYGTEYYAYLIRATTMPRPAIPEWASMLSPNTPGHHIGAFVASIAIAAYAIVGCGPTQPRVDGKLIVLVLAAASVRHTRMLPFYAVAWLMTIPAAFAATPAGEAARSIVRKFPLRVTAASTMVALTFAILWVRTTPWRLAVPNEAGFQGSPMSYPVGAVQYLETVRFRGKLLTPFEQGAFVSWKLYPHVKVSVDSRYEVAYPDEVVDAHLGLYRDGTDLPRLLSAYHPDALLVPSGSGLARIDIPWKPVYRDAGFSIYVRPGFEAISASGPVRPSNAFP